MKKHSGVIYLATPYSHEDPDVRQQRFVEACQAAANLMAAGYVVFCPIAHGHSVESAGLLVGAPHGFWIDQCRPMLERCDELYVVMMDGWRESVGVMAEVEIATAAGIPVRYLEP